MNERIQQLANVWANLRAKDDRLGITYTFSEKALEKFAELIVRECGNVAWQHTPETEELEYSHLIKDKILKQFGVEE